MEDCYDCDFNQCGACICPSIDKWYACPIESQKEENQKELEEMAKWCSERRGMKNDTN